MPSSAHFHGVIRMIPKQNLPTIPPSILVCCCQKGKVSFCLLIVLCGIVSFLSKHCDLNTLLEFSWYGAIRERARVFCMPLSSDSAILEFWHSLSRWSQTWPGPFNRSGRLPLLYVMQSMHMRWQLFGKGSRHFFLNFSPYGATIENTNANAHSWFLAAL